VEDDVVTSFAEFGYAGPLPGIDQSVTARFEESFRRGEIPGSLNPHLDSPVAAAICRSSALITTCQSLLGPNISIWRTAIFSGVPNLPLHRDTYRKVLTHANPDEHQISVQVAVSAAPAENCAVVIPGSHLLDYSELRSRFGLTKKLLAGRGNTRFAGATTDTVSRLVMQPRGVFHFPSATNPRLKSCAAGPSLYRSAKQTRVYFAVDRPNRRSHTEGISKSAALHNAGWDRGSFQKPISTAGIMTQGNPQLWTIPFAIVAMRRAVVASMRCNLRTTVAEILSLLGRSSAKIGSVKTPSDVAAPLCRYLS